jgi:hypothetical protein
VKTVKRIGWLGVVCLDAGAVACLRPHWRDLARGLAAPHAWVARAGADRAAASLGCVALWFVALWLALGFTAVFATAVPGRLGAASRCLAGRLLPAALLRTVAGAAGLSVLLAPIAADAKAVHGPPPRPDRGTGSVAAHPGPSWPSDSAPPPRLHVGWPTDRPAAPQPPRASHDAQPPRAAVPTPALPTTPEPSSTPAAASRSTPSPSTSAPLSPGKPSLPTPTGPTDSRRAAPPPGRHQSGPGRPGSPLRTSAGRDEVLVRPDDCLWLIAAQRLGTNASPGAIAAAWPQWYAANKRVIGPDPSLLHPGEVLHAPAGTDQGETR